MSRMKPFTGGRSLLNASSATRTALAAVIQESLQREEKGQMRSGREKIPEECDLERAFFDNRLFFTNQEKKCTQIENPSFRGKKNLKQKKKSAAFNERENAIGSIH